MIKTGTLALRGTRTTALVCPITFRGPDLAGADLEAFVLQNWDNDPAHPQVTLNDGVSAGATGLRLVGTETVDGVIETTYELVIAAGDMDDIPQPAEVGGDVNWVWYLNLTPSSGTKQRYLEGPFVIGGASAGGGNISGAIVTVTDQDIVISIEGADLIAGMVSGAAASAALAQAWAEGAGEPGGTGTKSAKSWVNYLLSNTGFVAVATDMLLGAGSKIVAVGTDLLLGATSKIAIVATDLALGASSLIGQAPGKAAAAAASAADALASAIASASNGIAQRGGLSRVAGMTDRFGYVFKSQDGLTLGGITLGGQLFAGLHPQSTAFGQLNTLVNTGLSTGAYLTKSGLDRALGGSTYGDLLPIAFNILARDSASKAMFGTDLTGAGWQAKYSPRIAAAVRAAEGPACAPSMPIIDEIAGAIVAYHGSATVTLTSEGTSSKPRMLTDKVVFKNDRFRSVPAWYQMNYDGTSQRAVLRDVYLEGVLVTGQSLATPYTSSPGLSITAPFLAQALMLTGGAIFEYPTVSSPTAALTGCKEPAAAEGIATRFAASVITNETPYRPYLKLVMFGCGYPAQAYTVIKKGTATYAEWLAQAARITTLAGGSGKFVVRGAIIMHGEADYANASYDLNLIEWQSDIETDIRATTGQKEPVYLFVNQIGCLRALAPTTPNTVKSPLLQLAASVANPKIVITVPDYIFTYNADNIHPTNLSKRLIAEYKDKAYRKVVGEGRDWRCVSPKTFTLGSSYVDIQFYVPVTPLLLDTAQCADPGNYGFTYSDGSGRTISTVTVTAPDTVRVALSGAIGSTAVLDFAYSNGTANKSGPVDGARGCLHDSDPAIALSDGTTHLYNPCVVWRQALN